MSHVFGREEKPLHTERIVRKSAARVSAMIVMKIAVLGSGTWGWSLARLLLNNGHSVSLWSSSSQKSAYLEEKRRNPMLDDTEMPEGITYTSDLSVACKDAEMVLFACASTFVRFLAERAKKYLPDCRIVVSAAKGIEQETLFSMSEVFSDVLRSQTHDYVAISGPTHAEEVSRDMPTAMVCACTDAAVADEVCQIFASPVMRTYPSTDIKGVELCGALKNIVALAAGMAKGLSFGDNAIAALITRGMTEIERLGKAMNCESDTFDGLAGVGDLMVTCFSSHSRNMRAGFLIGSGFTPEQAIEEVGMVVEGINVLGAAIKLADKYQIYMPILHAVFSVIQSEMTPGSAAEHLMTKEHFRE